MNINPEYIQFDDELLLAIYLARENLPEKDIRQLIGEKKPDWEKFISFSEVHRLTPYYFQHKNLTAYLPNAVYKKLKNSYKSESLSALQILNEFISLKKGFEANNIGFFSLKGVLLALDLYQNINHRYYRDIDLFVQPSDLSAAIGYLKNKGYKNIGPGFDLSTKQYRKNLLRTHEMVFLSKENLVIELHWRFFNNRHYFNCGLETMFESQNITSISGQTFFIPNEELNLLYLCCHGAYHRWFRLFWLKDFSYILQKHKFDPEKVLHQAKKLGLERLVSFSSKYAAGIFGVQNPFENLFAQKHNKYLIDRSIEALKTGAEMFETTKLKKASNIFYQLRLKKGLVYKIHCFKPLLPHYDDWKIIRLPNWLFFLYYPLRPVLWLYKKMGKTEK